MEAGPGARPLGGGQHAWLPPEFHGLLFALRNTLQPGNERAACICTWRTASGETCGPGHARALSLQDSLASLASWPARGAGGDINSCSEVGFRSWLEWLTHTYIQSPCSPAPRPSRLLAAPTRAACSEPGSGRPQLF